MVGAFSMRAPVDNPRRVNRLCREAACLSRAGGRGFFPGARVTRITKDCFGTVIASLKKMKECVRCELLAECRAINWQAQETEEKPSVVRRSPKNGDASNRSPA